jgi:hypothetical protein
MLSVIMRNVVMQCRGTRPRAYCTKLECLPLPHNHTFGQGEGAYHSRGTSTLVGSNIASIYKTRV